MLDEFSIYPREGDAFDVQPLLAQLRALPNAVALPPLIYFKDGKKFVRDDEFALCSSPKRAQSVLETALAGRGLDDFYGTVALVQVKPEWIWVHLLASPGVIGQVQDLLLPILRSGACRIFSMTGEVTADYAHAPERLFEDS